MKTAEELIERLQKKGILLWEEQGKIKYKANAGAMTSDDIQNLKQHKSAVLEYLQENSRKIEFIDNKAERYQPFLLTEVQQSYLMGRSSLFDYGGVACHIYLQLNYDHLDVERVEEIWNKLIEKHEMLRAVIYEDGYQKILEEAPHFAVTDYQDMEADKIQEIVGHSKYEIGTWPYFSIGVSNYPEHANMHFSIEFIIADWASIWILLREFEQMYFENKQEEAEVSISFRDYVNAERELKASMAYERDKKYWLSKMENFPTCPQIAINHYDPESEVRFERKSLRFTQKEWDVMKQYAIDNSITPTTLVLMVYAATLERYSENKRFAMNLTVLNRQPFHKDINKIIGDFTTISLLEVDFDNQNSFVENAQNVNERLFDDLDHNIYSGISFMREISRKKGKDAAFMPYVFTSAIGLLSSLDTDSLRGMTSGVGISQTPQVFIDCQVMDAASCLQINWDVRKGVFQEDTLEDMFTLFRDMLTALSKGVDINEAIHKDYPEYQKELFQKVNETEQTLEEHLLHENIIKAAQKYPDKTAVQVGEKAYTYRKLMAITGSIYGVLKERIHSTSQLVGIAMGKSVYQPASAIAILALGGVYVPISVEQGKKRIESIIQKSEIKVVLTLSSDKTEYPEGIEVIHVDTLSNEDFSWMEEKKEIEPSQLAYIIFTSGSTGEPKGVAITHEAAVNTIEDINKRYQVTEQDSVLGVSQLNFDLSVYDIFGLLSVGGTLVYPEESNKKAPQYLAQLIETYHITIWNSVPSLLQMVIVYIEFEQQKMNISSLRVALLSGDWIPLDLPEKFLGYAQNAQVVSLGGATEAAIWSIYHDYKGLVEGYKSIPYGKPLANQSFKILDRNMRHCPMNVKGDIYILGKGLAKGYYNDEEKTALQFVTNPYTGEEMYKTGDVGRYHKDGEIEFLGRSDSQIKLNGHRIELGEIEYAINRMPAIKNSVVIFRDTGAEKSLACCYETELKTDEQKEQCAADWDCMVEQIKNQETSTSNLNGDEYIAEQLGSFLKVYFEKNKNARILQIGSSSETIYSKVISILKEHEYSYQIAETDPTQVSESVKNQMDEEGNVKFCTIDLEQDILDQGYPQNAFDLILFFDQIDRLKQFEQSDVQKRNINQLIRPEGYVLAVTTEQLESWTCISQRQHALYAKQVKADKFYVSVKEITSYITEQLTSYMIPSVFDMIDTMPITANAKIDRKKISELYEKHANIGHTSNVNQKSDGIKNSMEQAIIDVWESLGIKGLGVTDNFYDFGADSIIMAQVTGKLHEEIAKHMTFDEILRDMLNYPTVKQLASHISKAADAKPANLTEDDSIGAVQLHEAGEGPLRVVFHAAFGTRDFLKPVIERLIAQRKGKVMTITLGQAHVYADMDPKTAVQQLADDYTKLILKENVKQVQLVGYCFGGWLASQCAVRLVEAGIEVLDMVMIDPNINPWVVEDEVMCEMMFVPNFKLDLSSMQSNFSWEVKQSVFKYLIEKFGKIPENTYQALLEQEEFIEVGRAFETMTLIPKKKRFEMYCDLIKEQTYQTVNVEMMEGLYKAFVQTMKATNGVMKEYKGDVRYLTIKQTNNMFYNVTANLEYWYTICTGNMIVSEIEGDHFTCIEIPENAKAVSEIIGTF